MNLDARLDQDATGWRPEIGDKLVGRIVDIDERISEYGQGTYPVLTIDTGHELVAVHAFHTVLKNEIAKRQPAVGDTVGIKYLGIPPGKSYESYRFVIDRDTTTPDWGQMAADATRELAAHGPQDAPATPTVTDDDDAPF